MLNSIRSKVFTYLGQRGERSKKVTGNILVSFGVKGLSILVGLVLVPMTINYIDPVQYGIWLTISSIVGWMYFFDIGMGNGLRNKLTHAIAVNEMEEAKKYISTTYAVLFLVAAFIFLVFFFVNPFINWKSILNIPATLTLDIGTIILIVLGSFCLQFVAQIITTILAATQQTGNTAIISFIGQLLVLLSILLLKKLVPGNLMNLVLILAGMPLLVMILASIYLYRTSLRSFMPSVRDIDFRYAKPLLGLGGVFFIIQLGALVLFQTDNIVITRILGPEYVTEFNVVYKLFSVMLMGFTIIITPYWSAFTDAYSKKDFGWIRSNIITIRKICLCLSIASVTLCAAAPYIFRFWLGETVVPHSSLTIAMLLYTIVFIWQTAHVFLLNGVGKLRLQLILVISSAILNIPLAFLFGKYWGLAGIVSVNTILFLVMGILFYIQSEKIINGNAKGIWNK